MVCAPVIFGCAGTILTEEERDFFSGIDPYGFILFRRNISEPDQLRQLTSSLRDSVRDPCVPIFVDQEGGRVDRLGPPHWSARPPALVLASRFQEDLEAACRAIRLNSRLMARDLVDCGISVSCMPVLDLALDTGHEVIGDRAYAADPQTVARCGLAACQGLQDCEVLPVIKHIPGHGRATVDSHHALPKIDVSVEQLTGTDFVPFRALREMPMAMTAHVLLSDVDPVLPVTLSAKVISDVIREEIGFDGLLITDDISMSALAGTLAYRARKALGAGCDLVLHCNGVLAEMREIAEAVETMSVATTERAARCTRSGVGEGSRIDFETDSIELKSLMADGRSYWK